MTIRCIFCGASFEAALPPGSTESSVTCPQCSGSFSVGEGGAQTEGMEPLLPDIDKAEGGAPADRRYSYVLVGVGVLAFVIVVSLILFRSKPSPPPPSAPSSTGGQSVQGRAVQPRPDANFARGVEFYKKKNYAASVVEFQKSLKNNPGSIASFAYLGGSYVRLRKYSDAIPYLEKGRSDQAWQRYVLINLGTAWEGLGDWRKAISAYSSLTSVDRQNGYAYGRLGFCYTQIGDYKGAEGALQEAVRINPNDQWARTQLAFVKKQLGK